MRKIKPKERNKEVAKTGKIPYGSQVHFRHLRNPSIAQIRAQLRKTEAELQSGSCHPVWGSKQLRALTRMLEAKLAKRAKKKLSTSRSARHGKADRPKSKHMVLA